MASVVLVHCWRLIPFSTVILLAGRTAIPKEIPEAAAIDGAGFWRTLFQINLPMMTPILSVAVLFGTIFTFTDMTVVYILTAGGPYDSTQTLPSLAFATGIQGSDLAAGAAISLFLVPVLIVIASFKQNLDLYNVQANPFIFNLKPTLENLRLLFMETRYVRWLFNTALVGTLVVVITLLLSIPAAYALARLTGRWGERLGIGIFLTYLVPPTLLFIPLSRVVAILGLQDSLWSLVLVYPSVT